MGQKTKPPQIGVAVVGTGFGQKVHIPGLQEHPRTQVVAVYHRDLAKAQAVAAGHQIPHACQTLEDVLALPEVEAVTISTPPFLHYEMAKKVLQAGKHLLLEKPVTLNVAEARELADLAETQGVVALVDFEFRFVPVWQLLAEYLAENYVGKKRLIKIDCLVPSRADADRPWNWYARQEQGGGVLGAIGSHIFDYVHWLFGDIKCLSAKCSTAIPLRRDPETGEMKVVDSEDTCLLMLELADGTPCQICLSSVTYQGRGHWVEIYGDRGTLVLGNDNQKDYVHGFRLWGALTGKALTEIEVPNRLIFAKNYLDGRIAPFIRVVDQWILGMEQKEEFANAPTLRAGVYSQLLMDLAQISHAQRSWVEVSHDE